MGKLIIITAPSGAGKTTIVKEILKTLPQIQFSVSATTRPMRNNEVNEKDYYFLSETEFRDKIAVGAFAEWEEVYPGRYYGTLRSEIDRIWNNGKAVLFDIDVLGAMNLQKKFPDESISIFIKPPSKEVLFSRLENRKTESEDSLKVRKERAQEELAKESQFDHAILNDDLDTAVKETKELILDFLNKPA